MGRRGNEWGGGGLKGETSMTSAASVVTTTTIINYYVMKLISLCCVGVTFYHVNFPFGTITGYCKCAAFGILFDIALLLRPLACPTRHSSKQPAYLYSLLTHVRKPIQL